MEVVPEWEDKLRLETSSRQALETATTTLGTLHAKEGRKNQFKTQKERDAHLKKLVESHGKALKDREGDEEGVKREVEAAKKEAEEVGERAKELRERLDGRKEGLKSLQEELSKFRESQGEAIEQRK